MVVSNIKHPGQTELLGNDEGWWESILNDEEINSVSKNEVKREKNSHKEKRLAVDWNYANLIYQTDTVVTLIVHGFNRGGLLVSGDQLSGFVPISHLIGPPEFDQATSVRPALSEYVNQKIHLKIIEVDSKNERLVFSERAASAGDGCRKQLFKDLVEGAIVSGTVTNLTEFGVFVDLGGFEGLIHISELSWGRVSHPEAVAKVGEQLKLIVLHVSEETSKVALSLKRLYPNPWDTVVRRYQPGDIVPAQITEIKRYGAFARLEEGVEGLIHNSSIIGSDAFDFIQEVITSGQQVEVQILHIDAEKRRMGLGLVLSE